MRKGYVKSGNLETMDEVCSVIDDAARRFIEAQHMFFVATSPLDPAGHVNLSPKGLDAFRILSPGRVAYLDFNGSGVETISHLKENGRIVLMFCSFQGPPKIFRLHGQGHVVEPDEAEFELLTENFRNHDSVRSIIVVEVNRVADSCGYGVPLFNYEGERKQLLAWAHTKGPEGLGTYREENNARSVDGLPGIRVQEIEQISST